MKLRRAGGITRRRPDEVEAMRRAGRVVGEMHARIRDAVRPGVTTAELDQIGRQVIEAHGATSNFLGYHGFPAVICTSPDDVIVHGIPGAHRLEEGHLISIDCGAIIDGYHADAAFTMGVGELDAETARLVEATGLALMAGIAAMVPGGRIGDIGHAVQSVAEGAGFAVVEEYVGHGIGTSMHEPPDVPNLGRRGEGLRLEAGNVLAVEPMVNAGEAETSLDDDGWTVRTADGSRSAHWEHTIAVTDDGPVILTQL